MMMSSMFLFGQNVLPGGYNMTITSKIILDGDLQTNTDYLVYAMHDGTVLGQSSIMQEGPDEYITEPLYYVSLEVEGNSGDVINFKLVADGKTYISSTEVNYVDNAMLGNLEDLYTIEFKSVAQIGNVVYPSLQEAFAAAAQTEELTTIELLPVTIEEDDDINTVEKTIKLPATLKNVIVKGADNNTSILKNLTIQNAQGGTYDMSNITFDGVVFDNSNIVLTGWRTGFESLKNLIVKNCVFRNIVRSSANLAAVHINVAADKAVNGFTFINNVIDGVTGAQNSGIYGQFTGEVIVKDNTINNVAFRPYVIQLTTDDGIADNFTVTGNTFSGSAAGRAQGLGNNAEGTDAVTLTVSNNIFKGITAAQQICYWNFNEATTTATLEKNYYGIDVMANPNRIYYNSAAQNITDLSEMGIFPIYTELKEDGTINEESLFNPVAYVGTVAYEALAEAFACQSLCCDIQQCKIIHTHNIGNNEAVISTVNAEHIFKRLIIIGVVNIINSLYFLLVRKRVIFGLCKQGFERFFRSGINIFDRLLLSCRERIFHITDRNRCRNAFGNNLLTVFREDQQFIEHTLIHILVHSLA